MGHVWILWPGFAQWEHTRLPLNRFGLILSGYRVGQVRVLCPTRPHSPHNLRPSFRGKISRRARLAAHSGLTFSQVWILWPFCPHPVHAREPRFFNRTIRRSADSGFTLGQVRILCPDWPQEAHTRPLLAIYLNPLFDL